MTDRLESIEIDVTKGVCKINQGQYHRAAYPV